MKQRIQTLFAVLFVLYCLWMLWLLFGQRWGLDTSGTYWQSLRESLNLVPLRTIGQYLRVLGVGNPSLARHAIINLAGNVVMFIPLGFFLPALYVPLRYYWRHLLCVLAILLLIELTQLFTLLGSGDVDDFLLNIPGTALGFFLERGLRMGKKAGERW